MDTDGSVRAPAGAAGTPPPTHLVVPLTEIGAGDLDRAGGKGANLGELVRAGFPVPQGFVVSAAAYDLHLARSGLAERVATLLSESPDGAAIRDALTAAPLPGDLAEALRAAYRELGQGEVAVRSSATAEDLPQAAFAGQQDTYLGIVSEDALLDAVRRCWASLWTQRAVSYRDRHGIEPADVRIAVVVQRMVPAEAAGVLFTANPVTGARDEMVVDASTGLGEAVVSGLVTPDHFVVDRRSARVQEWEPGRREVVIRGRPGGGTEHVHAATAAEPASDRAKSDSVDSDAALPDRALHRLIWLGAEIERHFGFPQDVEWAWAGGAVLILQARPITALPPAPSTSPASSPAPPAARPSTPSPVLPRAGRALRLMAPMLAEMLPVRPYPLDVTTWSGALVDAATTVVRFIGVRPPPLERICVEEDGVVVRLDPPAPRPTARLALAPVRLLRQAWRYDPATWEADPLLADTQARVRALEGRDLPALSLPELLVVLGEALATLDDFGELRRRYLPRPILAMAALRVLVGMLRRKDCFGALLSSVETKTTEANAELERLAARVRSDPALSGLFASRAPTEVLATLDRHHAGNPFRDELWAFLDRYGHRETVTALLASQPTWTESPEVVIGMLQGLAADPPGAAVPRSLGDAAYQEFVTHPLLRLVPARSVVSRLQHQARAFQQVREDTHFYGTKPLPAVRRVMRESGRRLHAAGILEAPDDVFHLKREELERVEHTWPPSTALARELHALAERRKAKRAALAGTPLINVSPSMPADTDGRVLLHGTPGSRGLANGPARVVRDSSEFGKLRSGDVLVAPYTNPSWTPLFQRAAAVVADTGGAGSHAAIVAREYGIPAVMGTGVATQRLADGQPVHVDGDRGTVSRE